jgi:hypothetical protein
MFLHDVITHLTGAVPGLPNAEMSAVQYREFERPEIHPGMHVYDAFVTLMVANIVVCSPGRYSIEKFPLFKSI